MASLEKYCGLLRPSHSISLVGFFQTTADKSTGKTGPNFDHLSNKQSYSPRGLQNWRKISHKTDKQIWQIVSSLSIQLSLHYTEIWNHTLGPWRQPKHWLSNVTAAHHTPGVMPCLRLRWSEASVSETEKQHNRRQKKVLIHSSNNEKNILIHSCRHYLLLLHAPKNTSTLKIMGHYQYGHCKLTALRAGFWLTENLTQLIKILCRTSEGHLAQCHAWSRSTTSTQISHGFV